MKCYNMEADYIVLLCGIWVMTAGICIVTSKQKKSAIELSQVPYKGDISMTFWTELLSYYTELSLKWKLIAAAVGLLAAGMLEVYDRVCSGEGSGEVQEGKAGQLVSAGLLIMYMTLVFASTVFDRQPGNAYQYEWELFWTWRAVLDGRTGMIREIIYNVLMLIPFGFLLPVALGGSRDSLPSSKRRRYFLLTVLTGFCCSAAIEALQLILKCGLFEFDDIVYNTLGVLAGYGIWILFHGKSKGK